MVELISARVYRFRSGWYMLYREGDLTITVHKTLLGKENVLAIFPAVAFS